MAGPSAVSNDYHEERTMSQFNCHLKIVCLRGVLTTRFTYTITRFVAPLCRGPGSARLRWILMYARETTGSVGSDEWTSWGKRRNCAVKGADFSAEDFLGGKESLNGGNSRGDVLLRSVFRGLTKKFYVCMDTSRSSRFKIRSTKVELKNC